MNVYEIWQTRGKILRDSDYVCGRRLQLRGCHLWQCVARRGISGTNIALFGNPLQDPVDIISVRFT